MLLELLLWHLAGWAGVVATYFMAAWAIRWWPFEEGA